MTIADHREAGLSPTGLRKLIQILDPARRPTPIPTQARRSTTATSANDTEAGVCIDLSESPGGRVATG